ncbi:MAG: hypothetical protein HYY17_10655 [Planctomycetes bacterium]|nr:hypothetical protein [Planctomycetota bacterium]
MGGQPFHLQSFEDEARSIVDAARSRARELLAAALAESKRIRDEAHREGVAAGEAEGRTRAEEAERARIREANAGITALLEGIARGIEQRRRELLANAERDLVGLAVAIAEKIVRAEVDSGKAVAAANVAHACRLLVGRNEMEVRLNPEDLEMVEAVLPEIRARFGGAARIETRPDPAVERGGCIVQTAQGGVDAELRTQLEEISRALMG